MGPDTASRLSQGPSFLHLWPAGTYLALAPMTTDSTTTGPGRDASPFQAPIYFLGGERFLNLPRNNKKIFQYYCKILILLSTKVIISLFCSF